LGGEDFLEREGGRNESRIRSSFGYGGENGMEEKNGAGSVLSQTGEWEAQARTGVAG